MAIQLLDLNSAWAKIKAGFKGGPFFKSPGINPNPTMFKDGVDSAARQVQQATATPKGSVFGGKTFSGRK